MSKITIRGKKYRTTDIGRVILIQKVKDKILSAVRRYPKGGEGRNWKVIVAHRGVTWWVTDLKNGIGYTVQRHFFDERNYVIEIERHKVD